MAARTSSTCSAPRWWSRRRRSCLLALTMGGTRIPWLSPATLGLVGSSILLTVVFAWWMQRAPEPFLPLHVLANPVMRVGTTATACALGVMTGLMIYMPLYYQLVHKLTATQSGLALIPVVVMTTPGSMMAGRAMMYLRHYKIMAYIGMAITVMAVAALVWWPTMPLSYAIAAAAIIGFGVGTVFPTTTVSIQNAVARHEIGVATGAMNFFRALASALVVAIMGAILLGRARRDARARRRRRRADGVPCRRRRAWTWPRCSAGCSWRPWFFRSSRWRRSS